MRTRALVIVTLHVDADHGLLVVAAFGGATIDRAVVASPAWQRLGPAAWAAYSRHADLGNGRIVYAIYGIGLAAFAIAAAISYRFDRHPPRRAGIPIYLSALAAIGVIATTIKAAPIMLGLPDLDDDVAALHTAFDEFTFWGLYIRGALGALAFLASLWALAAYPQKAVDPR